MTLLELIDLVSLKTHRDDDYARDEARKYIQARYRMFWDSRPWRDSLAMLTIPAAQVTREIILPGIVDRVQKVRWKQDTLGVDELTTIFDVDPGRFERESTPLAFSILSPSGVSVSPGGGAIIVRGTDAGASFTVSITGRKDNAEVSETLNVVGTANITSQFEYDEIASLSKDSAEYALEAYAGTEQILALSASETGRKFQRVSFQVNLSETQDVMVLFKRQFVPLVNDSDETKITGIDNALLAAAIADVLEGQRQYAKAQAKMAEAMNLAQQAADLETNQSASEIRIIPFESAGAPDWSDTWTSYAL